MNPHKFLQQLLLMTLLDKFFSVIAPAFLIPLVALIVVWYFY